MDDANATNLLNTVIHYCRDLLEEIGGYHEFAAENGALEEVLDLGPLECFDQRFSERLSLILERYRGRVLALMMRTPESPYLDRLHKRIDSLVELSRTVARESEDE